jgi:transposase
MRAGRFGDDGAKASRQASLFYEFRLDDMIPKGHLLRRINVFVTSVLGDLQEQLGPFYSDIGRPSIDPELLIRMLIIDYCFGIRSERKLCEEVRLHLAFVLMTKETQIARAFFVAMGVIIFAVEWLTAYRSTTD